VWTQVLAELVRIRPKGKRCGGADADRCRSLFFIFFGETVYTDEGSRPVDRCAAQLATSRLTDTE
jgi:hypothetical protein